VLIGPRTQEQLDGLLSGADLELTGAILDRIDEMVPPGTDLNPADNYAATPRTRKRPAPPTPKPVSQSGISAETPASLYHP
jgi:hypothetical protein